MSTREEKIVRTGLLGILMNISLVLIKGTIGFFSGSIAVVLDALNNLTDVLSALVTVVGTKLAHKAPDKNHPFGHGRFEDLAAFVVGLIIFFAGVSAIVSAAPRIVAPSVSNFTSASYLFIILAVVLKLLFSRHARRLGKTLDSASLVATGTDAFFDAIISFATLVSALLLRFLNINIEGFVGIIIGAFIIKSAVEIIFETTKQLIGSRVDNALAQKIQRTVARFPEVTGAYDLMLHSYGPVDLFGSIHISVSPTLSAREIHDLSTAISAQVYTTYGVLLTVGLYDKRQFKQYKK
ncbi:cation transporter [Candidatus Saccharibacteria bacterium]|nr:cation transporter [Candidatus Saccharibacteria bacterium]